MTASIPLQVQSGITQLLESSRDSLLIERIAQRPDEARDALRELLTLAVTADGSDERVYRLSQAERLATLYRRAWSDAFLVERVRMFALWSADERAEKLEADSLKTAGNGAYRTEGPETAIRLWELSLTKLRALGDQAGQAAVMGNLGAGYYALGQLERALRYHTSALELAEAAGDHRTRGNALGNIANIHRQRGDLALAGEYFRRALEIRPLTGDRRGQVADLNNMALVRADLGDPIGAEQYLRQALALNRGDGRDGAAANNLTNLANLATERGDYQAAIGLYSEALTARRRADDRAGEALDLENLGLLHLRWGDYPAAMTSLAQALAILEEIGPPIRRAEVLSDIAATHNAMGELQAALDTLARAEVEAAGDEYLAPVLTLQRADLLADLNEDRIASGLYQQAQAGYARLDDLAGQAEAEQGLGHLYLSRDDFGAAEDAFNQALLLQENLEDPRPAALTLVLLGDVKALTGDTAAARRNYQRALATHTGLGDRAAEAMTMGALADLDRQIGAQAKAVAGYRAALARLEGHPIPPVGWRLHYGLGLALRSQGLLDQAAAALRSAVAEVEQVGSSIAVDQRRYRYLEDKWEVLAELAKTELARGNSDSAFNYSESLRARQLLDLMARGRTTTEHGPEELIRREEDLRRHIGQLTASLAGSSSNPRSFRGAATDRDESGRIRESLIAARAEYEQLLEQLRATRPEYASLVGGSTSGLAEVQRVLPDDAVLIEYLVSQDWTMAFVVSADDIAAVEVPLSRDRLHELVRFFRGTVKPDSGGPGGELWRTPLRTLHRYLIEPLERAGHLEGKRLLILAPHGELHYLPFGALLRPQGERESFLVESYDLAYVPSASVWLQLKRRGRRTAGDGVLAMAPLPEVLRNSVREVRVVTGEEPGATVVIGNRATEARFRELAPDRRVLHLATTGVLNSRNPLFSYIRMSPSGKGDGRLEVHEVFALKLAADLVVLSACETGLGTGARQEVPPGDDWVGLVRAFLYAGAGSVVASLWPVEDEATARLMETFYQGLREGVAKPAALSAAQRSFINDPERSSPFYWAAFGLTGSMQ